MWQQLANNAGFLPGKYSGVPGPSPAAGLSDQVGVNIPASSYGPNLGYAVSSFWYPYAFGGVKPQNVITLASCCHPVDKHIEGGGLTPTDAYKVDLKIDDGQPDAGTMRIYAGYTSCVTTTTPGPAEYNITYTGQTCQVIANIGQ